MQYYVGMDNHKKFSYMSVMDKRGAVVKEGKVVNTKETVNKFLANIFNKEANIENA